MFVRRRSGKYRVKAKVIQSTSGQEETKPVRQRGSSATISSFIYAPHSPSSASSASSTCSAVIVHQSNPYLNMSPPTVSACHVTADRDRKQSAWTTRGEACPLRPDDDTRPVKGVFRPVFGGGGGGGESARCLRNTLTSRRDDNNNSACRWEADDGQHREPTTTVQRAPVTDATSTGWPRPQHPHITGHDNHSSSSSSNRRRTNLPSTMEPLTTYCRQRALTRGRWSRVSTQSTAEWSRNSLRMTSCHDSCSCQITNCHRVDRLPRCTTNTTSSQPTTSNCYLTTSRDDRTSANEAGTTRSVGRSMKSLCGRHVITSECSPTTPAAIYSSSVKITCPSPILMTSVNDVSCQQDAESDKENLSPRTLNETPQGCFVSSDRLALVRSSTARDSLRTLFDRDELIEPLPDVSNIKYDNSFTDNDHVTKTPPSGHGDTRVDKLPKMRRSDGCTRLQKPVTMVTAAMTLKSNTMKNKRGQINLSVYINSGHLTVHVVQARHLALDCSLPNDTTVQVSLIPADCCNSICRTDIFRDSIQPRYDEKFSFELTGADLQRRLLVSVWQVADDPSLDQLVGATSFGIHNIASSKTIVEGWYWLLDGVIAKIKHQMATPMQSFQRTLEQMQTYTLVMEKDKGQSSRAAGIGYGLTLSGGTPCTISRIVPSGPAHRAGLQTGDVISRVNGHSVMCASTDSVARIIRHSSRGVVMQIQRHVTPPIDAHQLRMIALAYAVSDDVNTLSDDDEDDEDRSSLYENSVTANRHLHGNEHRRSMYNHCR